MWHEITFLIYPLPLEDIYGTGNVIFCGMPMQYAAILTDVKNDNFR